MQYWKTYQKELIIEKLNLINETETDITLWQQLGSSRITYQGKLIQVSRALCKIKLNSKQEKDVELIDSKLPIFVMVPKINLIFKKENYNYFNRFFEFSQPGEVQMLEKRKIKRFYYKYQDFKNITFCSKEISAETEKPAFTIASVLIDISTTGVGLVVNKDDVQKIHPGCELYLQNLTDQKLPTPFLVTVSYVEPYQIKEQNLYRVGICFADELDSISYKSITSIVQIKQNKMEGLSKELYCGLDHEDQVKTLNVIESSNQVMAKNIRDNIEYLDRLRYMTTQMKREFLQEVNLDKLAIAFRLSSKELIYDLFTELSANMQNDFLDKLQSEKPASAICKSQDEIVKIIKEKEGTGEYILDPLAFTTYV